MQVDGRCHCGAISFSAEIHADKVLVCHCNDCQILSGSAYRSVAPALPGSFRLLSGKPSRYVKIAADGTRRAQVFCGDCGSPIYAGPVGDETGMLGIRVGVLRQRAELPPQRQYWCDSALPWVEDLAALPKIASE